MMNTRFFILAALLAATPALAQEATVTVASKDTVSKAGATAVAAGFETVSFEATVTVASCARAGVAAMRAARM
jgi:ABC-type thiamine transport system substrate-binding protein